ncbi:PIN domain-containing protein [Vibrio jasicida]|uniref:PIN domain-containing protein n=1 Tax=Vibrio jasicida TaxID=766224 RepID=UPI0040675923
MIPIIIGAAALVAAAYGGKKYYDYTEEEKEKAEAEDVRKQAQEKADEARRHQEALSRANLFIKSFESQWDERLSDLVVIDSNIWMNYDYDDLFNSLESYLSKSNNVIKIPQVQFDEIVNLKNLPYGNVKSKLARCALSRIERLQNSNAIKIIPLGFDAEKEAYADPEIIKLLIKATDEYNNLLLITDDRELRIRANQLVSDANQNTQFKSIDGLAVQKEFKEYNDKVKFVS